MDRPAAELDGTHQSNDGGRVKKPRKRPKLGGCIPCAKRRQKCDGTRPCSFCTERGTPQLCRWDSIPDTPSYTRFQSAPTPAEVDLATESGDSFDENEDGVPSSLQNTKLDFNEKSEALKDLSRRIQSLESRVGGAGPVSAASRKNSMIVDTAGGGAGPSDGPRMGNFSANSATKAGSYEFPNFTPLSVTPAGPVYLSETLPSDPSGSITSSSTQSSQTWAPVRPSASRRQSEASPKVPASQDDSYDRVASFSLVHRGEFIGPGNVLYALHSIRSSSPLRLPSTNISALTSAPPLHSFRFVQSLIPCPEVQHLIQYIPMAQSGNPMVDAFFKEVNWRYGIPKRWFQNTCGQMWAHLQNPIQGYQLNLHWLCLFFSVLACTPQPGESSTLDIRPFNTHDSGTYFLCASVARRLTEDHNLDQPVSFQDFSTTSASPADSCVLSCLATPLLCDFLAERGRLSEAWKLVGNGIRIAQSVGLDRDPGSPLWQDMSEEEKNLRRRAWWSLFIWDRLYSHTLGRPHMVRGDIAGVAGPGNGGKGGRKNSFLMGRSVMIQLAELVGEINDKCTGVQSPTLADLTEMDSKFQAWQSSIPAEFRPGTTPEQDIILFAGLSQAEIQNFSRQRYMIVTWYCLTRLKIYTLALKFHSPSSPRPGGSPGLLEPTAENCIRHSLDAIRFQCNTFENVRRLKFGERSAGNNWYFEGCLSLFEAAVALILVFTKFPKMFLASPGADIIEESKKGLKLGYEELTKILSRAAGVFSEVLKIEREPSDGVVKEEGKRAETAAKALKIMNALLREHWWKLNPKGGGPPSSSSPVGSVLGSSPPPRPESSPTTTESGSMASVLASMMPLPQKQTYPSMALQAEPPPPPPFQPFVPPNPTMESRTPQPVLQQQMNYPPYPNTYGNMSSRYIPPSYSPPAPPPYPSYSPQVPQFAPMGPSFAPPQLNQSVSPESFSSGPPTIDHPPQQTQTHQVSPQSTISPSPGPLSADGSSSYGTEYPFTSPPPPPPTTQPPQQYPYIPQRLPPPPQISSFLASNPMRTLPSATNAAARAYAYTPTPSSSAAITATATSSSARPPPRPPAHLSANQGMRMIHYVAPGSTAASATGTTSPITEARAPMSSSSSSDLANQPQSSSSTGIPDYTPGVYYKP